MLSHRLPTTVLVATPGRLLDLAGMPYAASAAKESQTEDHCVDGVAPANACVSLSSVRYLAIDEADKMLSMGLGEQARAAGSLTFTLATPSPPTPAAASPARMWDNLQRHEL